MKTKSVNAHRLKDPLNSREKAFLEVWQQVNQNQNILRYILDGGAKHGQYFVTPTEEKVAETLIQWLGSPVGQHFLSEVALLDKKGQADD